MVPPKKTWQGKHREFGNFAKTQGILFAQVVNSLIQKVKDIAIFCRENFQLFLDAGCLPSQFCVYISHKSRKLAQKNCGRIGKTQGI